MMKYKKMFSKTVKRFADFFQVLLLFLEVKMSKRPNLACHWLLSLTILATKLVKFGENPSQLLFLVLKWSNNTISLI